MAKNIVVLSDGTGNSSAKLARTNVWRVYEALDLTGDDQVALYDDGVGTSSFRPLALLGGAFGWGLKRNILDLYVFLCRNYQPGDKIFGFGFSRGAFTIRVLLGFLASEGVITGQSDAELARLARHAYRSYRSKKYTTKAPLVHLLRPVRNGLVALRDRLRGRVPYSQVAKTPVTVEFAGLWDTVDAYGLPVDELTAGWSKMVWPLSLPNCTLSPIVQKACHALSLDDERNTFHPVLWDEKDEAANQTSRQLADERLSQVWFAGMHSDAGGGYPDDSAAHVSLSWIGEEAAARGLRFQASLLLQPGDTFPSTWKTKASFHTPIHDSRRGPGVYYRYNPRKLYLLTQDSRASVQIGRPKIHESVFERIQTPAADYAPIVLPQKYAVVTRAGDILDGPANPFETPAQAAARNQAQEAVWDRVWGRRIAYFASVAWTLWMVLLPFCPRWRDSRFLDGTISLVSQAMELSKAVLPDFAGGWLEYYKVHSLRFLLLAAGLIVLNLIGGSLQRSLSGRMAEIWKKQPKAVVQPGGGIFRLRSHSWYRGFFVFLNRLALPYTFGIVMLLLLLTGVPAVVFRAGFQTVSALGGVCQDTAPQNPGWASHEICHATGIRIQKDKCYRIELQLPQGKQIWKDATHPVASPAGFTSGENPLVFYPAVPFRRVLGADWFVPVAQVGATRAEQHVLSEPVTVFRAQSSGPLFLFVNDVPLPYFYRNNQGGKATVKVDPVACCCLGE
jgi:uncharacterized protein (DUF2235 family)